MAAELSAEEHLAAGDRLLASSEQNNYVWAPIQAAQAAAHYAAASARLLQGDRLASRSQ